MTHPAAGPDGTRPVPATGRVPLAGVLPRPVAYVLGGGAAYGAVQLGMLQALAETDLAPDLVVGTSVGALNGAVVAEDPVAADNRLTFLWAGVSRDDVFGTALRTAYAVVRNRPWVVASEPLQALVERSVRARSFDQLTTPLVAVTTDLDTGQTVPLAQGPLVPALLASSAIPGVFPWVEWAGRRLVDGGVTANVPLQVAVDRGAASLVVLDCGFTVSPRPRPHTLATVLMQTASIMTGVQVRRDLAVVAADRPVLYLPGGWPLGTRPDDFLRATVQAQRAYQLSRAFLREVRIAGPGVYGTPPGTVG